MEANRRVYRDVRLRCLIELNSHPKSQGKYLKHALGFLAPLALGRDLFPYRGFYNGTSKQVNIGRLLLGESERLTL
jgi:hypothetical protein